MKTKMTREECRATLRMGAVQISTDEELQLALKKLEDLGYSGEHSKGGAYLHIWSGHKFEGRTDLIKGFCKMPLSDLLSIEVVEEPDYKARFEECLKVLAQLWYEVYTNPKTASDESLREKIEKAKQFIQDNKGV